MNRIMFVFHFLMTSVVGVPALLYGQITITSADIQNQLGDHVMLESTEEDLTVDLGSPGGPQVWDYRALSTPVSFELEVVDPGDTPFGSEFTTSNLALKVEQDEGPDFNYEYTRLESDQWIFQGVAFDFTDSSIVQHWDPEGRIPLPVTMGSSWVFENGWSDTLFNIITEFEGRGHAAVDAWGTVILPSGSFETLRTVSFDTSITTITNPPFSFADTTTEISYLWMSTDLFFVIEIVSLEGETNPNFTVADDVIRFKHYIAGGIEEGGETVIPLPRAVRLNQNIPNPFNPSTTISFDIPGTVGAKQTAVLTVYDLRGRRVRTLMDSKVDPGSYQIHWDGRNDRGESVSSGIYFYTLKAGDDRLVRKMTIQK